MIFTVIKIVMALILTVIICQLIKTNIVDIIYPKPKSPEQTERSKVVKAVIKAKAIAKNRGDSNKWKKYISKDISNMKYYQKLAMSDKAKAY